MTRTRLLAALLMTGAIAAPAAQAQPADMHTPVARHQPADMHASVARASARERAHAYTPATDLRSPDARDAALGRWPAHAGTAAADRRSPDARDAASQREHAYRYTPATDLRWLHARSAATPSEVRVVDGGRGLAGTTLALTLAGGLLVVTGIMALASHRRRLHRAQVAH